MSRLQFLIVLAVVLLIVAYGNWLVKTFQTTTGIAPRVVRHEPDFFIEDVISTQMDADGKPLYRLQAAVINHYPDDKSLALQAPLLEYFRHQLPPWTAIAEAGRVYAVSCGLILFSGFLCGILGWDTPYHFHDRIKKDGYILVS